MIQEDKTGFPTVGRGPGETIDVFGDEQGKFSFEGEEEVLKDAGLIPDNNMASPLGELGEKAPAMRIVDGEEGVREVVRQELPDHAELLDDGRLRAKNNRSYGGFDYFNGRRRFILQKLDGGMDPLPISEEYGITDSYVYRTRSVFGFILEDDFLKDVFLADEGTFAPTYDPSESEASDAEGESETVEDVIDDVSEEDWEDSAVEAALEHAENPEDLDFELDLTEYDDTENLSWILEQVYRAGRVHGKVEAIKDLEEVEDEPEPTVVEETVVEEVQVFDPDEWWDLTKTLMEHGEDEYARRIASKVDFDNS